MPGKTRPSLRNKTIENVKRSNLSTTDKNCIIDVFRRYELIVKTLDELMLKGDDIK